MNKAWILVMGFLLWSHWKERNKRIFQERKLNNEEIWNITMQGIKETILSEKWEHDYWVVQGLKGRILKKLNLKEVMLSPYSWKQLPPRYHVRNSFNRP